MRECGECVACCVYLRIEELDKPPMKHCKFLRVLEPIQENTMQLSSAKNGNCKDYENRPLDCRNYRCAWLRGYGAEEDRPDKSLILAQASKSVENAVECVPLAPDSADSVKGQLAIARISQSINMVALVGAFYENGIVRVVGKPV